MQYPPRGPERKANYDLNGVSCTSTKACIAVGSRGLVERWNGRKWLIGHSVSVDLQRVSCPRITWCMGVDGGRTVARWNGHRWAARTLKRRLGKARINLNDVSCLSATSCAAVGWAGGTTVPEHWNGRTWAIESTPRITRERSPILWGVSCALRIGCTAVGGFDLNTSNGQVGVPLVEHRS